MRQSLAAVLIAALAASCTSSSRPPERRVETAPTAAPATPSCIELTRIREARVIDDRTIDFYLRDGTVLRNNLPNQCPGLGFERAFSYSTSLSRLCSTDIITVIQSNGTHAGASCGLGRFEPAPAAPATP